MQCPKCEKEAIKIDQNYQPIVKLIRGEMIGINKWELYHCQDCDHYVFAIGNIIPKSKITLLDV